jgi:hypothetical protein
MAQISNVDMEDLGRPNGNARFDGVDILLLDYFGCPAIKGLGDKVLSHHSEFSKVRVLSQARRMPLIMSISSGRRGSSS